jgi:hypothetical protein
MIFAREASDSLTSLVKKLDKLVAENKANKMGSFVVFCSDDSGLEAKLKDVIAKEKIENVVLAIDNPAGPAPYKIAKEADITVVLYTKSKVVANHSYKKGGLTDKEIDKIVADVPKILPSK